jgi:hypothetical protein
MAAVSRMRDDRSMYLVLWHLRVALAIGVTLCLVHGPSSAKTYASKEPPLIATLKDFKSDYTWFQDLNRYVLNNKAGLEQIVAVGNLDRNIRVLAECMDSPIPSKVILDGKQVPLGMICYEGLTLLIYYEPTTPKGDIARKWPGYVSPSATKEELRSAKKAWKKVIQQHSYKRL